MIELADREKSILLCMAAGMSLNDQGVLVNKHGAALSGTVTSFYEGVEGEKITVTGWPNLYAKGWESLAWIVRVEITEWGHPFAESTTLYPDWSEWRRFYAPIDDASLNNVTRAYLDKILELLLEHESGVKKKAKVVNAVIHTVDAAGNEITIDALAARPITFPDGTAIEKMAKGNEELFTKETLARLDKAIEATRNAGDNSWTVEVIEDATDATAD